GYLAATFADLAGGPHPRPLSQLPPPVSGRGEKSMEEEDLVRWLAAEVARLAGAAPGSVDPHQPLAGSTLDSLATIELLHGIERRTSVAVDLEALYAAESLQELALSVARRQSALEPAAQAAPLDQGDFPLSKGQLSLWFLHALAPESPAYNVPNAVRV